MKNPLSEGWGPTPASQCLLQLPSRSGSGEGVALVLPACTLSSALLETLLKNTVQTSSCNSKVPVEKGEDVTVYFAVQSVPSVSVCGGQRLFPYPHVGPLLQPAQAGRYRVRVPSPAPPPASFFLSQLRSSSEKGGSVIVPI